MQGGGVFIRRWSLYRARSKSITKRSKGGPASINITLGAHQRCTSLHLQVNRGYVGVMKGFNTGSYVRLFIFLRVVITLWGALETYLVVKRGGLHFGGHWIFYM